MSHEQDPDSYWSGLVPPGDLADMARKYGALLRIIALPEGPERRRELREIAATWPGALREAQLIPPERIEARAEAVKEGASSAARPRTWWREVGHGAPVLWADLHRLLGDQLRWRRAGAPVAFADYVRSADARGVWPDAATLSALGGSVHARLAYRWLARRAGMSLPALNHVLFERAGHWDHRPGD